MPFHHRTNLITCNYEKQGLKGILISQSDVRIVNSTPVQTAVKTQIALAVTDDRPFVNTSPAKKTTSLISCLLIALRPNKLVYLRDGSALTTLRVIEVR